MPTNDAHTKRVNDDLRRVGLTKRGMKKFTARSVYELIHPDERIMGAIIGRYSAGSFNWYEGMLVCTDRRALFIDLTPGVRDFTELTYDIITGIEHRTTGPFTSVTLFTGIENYSLRFVDIRSANILVGYVERRRLEQPVPLDVNAYDQQDDKKEA